eukprot:SAG31_NODE_30513_length_380_cov_0.722420_1_plen_58_part_10
METFVQFMTEVDNVAYQLALSERVRSRVEEMGRVQLTDKEAAALARTKAVHIFFVVFS